MPIKKLYNYLFYAAMFIFLVDGYSILEAKVNNKRMVVMVPSYNNSEWVEKNLDSVFTQKYPNFRVIYINDCSADDTGSQVEEMINKYNLEHKIIYFDNQGNPNHTETTNAYLDLINGKKPYITLVHNVHRNGALSNLYRGIMSCDDDEIIVTLDGDDWLSDSLVLADLNQVYSKKKPVWITHGRLIETYSGHSSWCQPIEKRVVKTNTFRQNRCPSHLRTFYAGLFKKIKLADLLYEGEFFPMTWDMAIMYPMFEMASERHYFMKKVNYVYNTHNSINDNKVNPDLQIYLDQYIRSMPPYSRIKKLF